MDYAPPTLKQVQVQLKQNQAQLAEDDKKLKALEAATYVSPTTFPPSMFVGLTLVRPARKNTPNGSPSGTERTSGYGPRSLIHDQTRRSSRARNRKRNASTWMRLQRNTSCVRKRKRWNPKSGEWKMRCVCLYSLSYDTGSADDVPRDRSRV